MIVNLIRDGVVTIGETKLGIVRSEIGSKSIRSGAAMAMYLEGTPVFSIMLVGHWSSTAFLKYIRKQVQEFSHIISYHGGERSSAISYPFVCAHHVHFVNFCQLEGILQGDSFGRVFPVVVRHYEAQTDAKFVTVKGTGFPKYGFFQAFFDAEKGCAIARRSLKVMLKALSGIRPEGEFLGPTALMEALMEVENITNATDAKYNVNNVHLLNEVNLCDPSEVSKHPKLSVALASKIGSNLILRIPRGYGDDCQFQEGACNFVVLDESDGSIYFYSRVLGTEWCGSLIQGWPCNVGEEEAEEDNDGFSSSGGGKR
jgi:hypothetical protein